MQEVYTVMTATLGAPIRPDQAFNWEYYEDGPGGNGKAKAWQGTPREFIPLSLRGNTRFVENNFVDSRKRIFICVLAADRIVSLINHPRNDYGRLYTVDKLRNVRDGRPALCRSFCCTSNS